jgi:hypothetical protein
MASSEWEYHTLEKLAPKGQYADIVVGADTTSEASARLTFWYKHQAEIIQFVQPWLDNGWEPVAEIGPGSLVVTTSAEHAKGCLATIFGMSALGYNWWWVGVRIPLHRRKQP